MKKGLVFIVALLLVISCGEELISKPDNLISQEKMANIIQEMAIINAAKTTNSAVFRENNIEPTQYVLKKFNVDSLQYVASDRYYVSKPLVYQKIFKLVEKRLEVTAKTMSETKRKKDSLLLKKQRDEARILQEQRKIRTDSLP